MKPTEARLIDGVLAFANLPAGFAPSDVYALADPWGAQGRVMPFADEAREAFEPTARRAFPKDQRLLRAHLERLLVPADLRGTKPYVVPDSVARWTAKKVREGMLARYSADVTDDGSVDVQTIPTPTGVGVWSAMGLLFLLDQHRPYRAALRRCKLDACRNWFMALGHGKGKKEYCPDGCYTFNDRQEGVHRARANRRGVSTAKYRESLAMDPRREAQHQPVPRRRHPLRKEQL